MDVQAGIILSRLHIPAALAGLLYDPRLIAFAFLNNNGVAELVGVRRIRCACRHAGVVSIVVMYGSVADILSRYGHPFVGVNTTVNSVSTLAIDSFTAIIMPHNLIAAASHRTTHAQQHEGQHHGNQCQTTSLPH